MLNNSHITYKRVSLSVWWELGDSLGSFNDGMLGKFSWEKESDGSLDFSGWESLSLVISDESGGFITDLSEDILDERVHDAHWSLWDTGLLVNLLKDSEDVDWEWFGSSLSSVDGGWSFGGWCFTWFSWHYYLFLLKIIKFSAVYKSIGLINL